VSFDDSPASRSALQKASEIAGAYGGTLTIAHAVQPRVSSLDGGATILRALDAEREQAWNLLSGARQSLDPAVPASLEVVSGDPVAAIVRLAAELKPDLIVVGSHQRGALERFLVGSVSDGIVRRAVAPVLVVPLAARELAHAA
jgi:nucleotide-binding universal stress UspA family protein